MVGRMDEVSKKERILKSAVDIFLKNGKKSTIAEIGAAAQVTDSIIYHYFSSKEDLLFFAAGEQVKGLTRIIIDELDKIDDPVLKLKQLIRHQLHFHDTHPNYAYLTIFECRAKERFFSHPAFSSFREYLRILRDIITDGVQKGLFQDETDLPVFRDAVFGLLDMESIIALSGRENTMAHADVEAIAYLLFPVLLKKICPTDNALTKSERILYAAETIFSEKGFDGATMSEIAKMAHVAEGTLYEYFKNKEDLLFSTLQYRIRQATPPLAERNGDQSPFTRLRMFIRTHLFQFIEHPEFMRVFVFDGIYNRKFYDSKAASDFFTYVESLYPILDDGKKMGLFKPELDNRIYRNLFLGLTSHMALRWRYLPAISQDRKFLEMKRGIRMLLQAAANQGGLVSDLSHNLN